MKYLLLWCSGTWTLFDGSAFIRTRANHGKDEEAMTKAAQIL